MTSMLLLVLLHTFRLYTKHVFMQNGGFLKDVVAGVSRTSLLKILHPAGLKAVLDLADQDFSQGADKACSCQTAADPGSNSNIALFSTTPLNILPFSKPIAGGHQHCKTSCQVQNPARFRMSWILLFT